MASASACSMWKCHLLQGVALCFSAVRLRTGCQSVGCCPGAEGAAVRSPTSDRDKHGSGFNSRYREPREIPVQSAFRSIHSLGSFLLSIMQICCEMEYLPPIGFEGVLVRSEVLFVQCEIRESLKVLCLCIRHFHRAFAAEHLRALPENPGLANACRHPPRLSGEMKRPRRGSVFLLLPSTWAASSVGQQPAAAWHMPFLASRPTPHFTSRIEKANLIELIATYNAAVTPPRGLFKVSELKRDNKIKSNSVRQWTIIKLLREPSV